MITLTRPEIEALIDLPAMARAIEEAYRASSAGRVTLPPVGHITFPAQDADCHIKYGHMDGDPNFVVKVATGFPGNAAKGLPTGGGVVLVLSAQSGEVRAVLHDEMLLTDIRTALGGAMATRLMSRADSKRVLVAGTGPQARRQIEAHIALMPQELTFGLWGRDLAQAEAVCQEMSDCCDIACAPDLGVAVQDADIIITATGAKSGFVLSRHVRHGTHITAVGADAPGKQELETDLVARADIIAVDHITQCADHGEVSNAIRDGRIGRDQLRELGSLLDAPAQARQTPAQITLADLTGIAAQDIAIANAVLDRATG